MPAAAARPSAHGARGRASRASEHPVSPAQVRYHPDEWAHDLDEWWTPLTGLVAKADCASDDWLSVLGVGEFFEPRLRSTTNPPPSSVSAATMDDGSISGACTGAFR